MKKRSILAFAGVLALGLSSAACAAETTGVIGKVSDDGINPAHERAERSFNEFAKSWMEKLARAESDNRLRPKLESSGGTTVSSYRGYGEGFQIELKPTGSSTAPWVGILRYDELKYSCADRAARSCSPSGTRGVTEIFRYQGGKWVY